jgi:Motility quorum-sensing regulator, toxin of MqsA
MTTYADNRVWQDVYHAATPAKQDAYIKMTPRDEAPGVPRVPRAYANSLGSRFSGNSHLLISGELPEQGTGTSDGTTNVQQEIRIGAQLHGFA